MLISKISQQSSKIFGETHVKEVYDKKVENLLKQHGDGLGSSEKINKEFAERMLYEMSCRVLSEFSTSISSYKDGVGDLISMPPMSSTGINTATSDTVMEMMVKPISRLPLRAASKGASPSSSIWR